MPIHTTHTRDAALRELGRLNRWLVAGSVALTGAFAEAAANAFPGKTSKPASATRRAKGAAARTHAPAKTATHPLQPPAQAPQATAEAESSSSSQQSTPAQESTPAPESQESASAQEPAPAQEAAPAQESPAAPESGEAAPAQESVPAQEPAPAQEASAPVVSGGS